jgi:spermidine/putrescine transport system ATP-binding protein
MRAEIKALHQRLQTTTVYVTHDQVEAMTMADRIAVMNEGRIEQLGSGEELYERPQTEFVANFLGLSNLLDGTVSGRGGEMATFQTEEGERVLVPEARVAAAGDGTLRVGVRPEKIAIAAGDPQTNGATNRIHGRVIVASFLGVSIHYLVSTSAGRELTVIAPNRDVGAESIGPGRDVVLTWDPLHTFIVQRQESTNAP